MAKNRVYEYGDAVNVPVIAGTVSGGPVVVGMLPGVALTTRDANGNASVRFGQGAYTVNVTATGAITLGQPIYITSSTYALSDSSGAGKQLYGHALSTSSGTGTKSIVVRVADYAINGTAATPA